MVINVFFVSFNIENNIILYSEIINHQIGTI